MQIKFIFIYAVYTTENEYGQLGSCIGFFTKASDANLVAEGKGWYGGKGVVQTRRAIQVDDKYYLLDKYFHTQIIIDTDLEKFKEKKKEEALAKLTEEEKILLGLKKYE